jgi:hypothetical protein
MVPMPRPVYLARIRRAFLLRVHPDRFRNHSATVRNNQANLVKALAERMSQTDFSTWQQSGGRDITKLSSLSQPSGSQDFSYVVERRDGSLLRASLRLSDTVDSILASMAKVLKSSGAASLPAPPKEQEQPQLLSQRDFRPTSSSSQNNKQSSPFGQDVDPRFNVVSNRGRDFASFLSTLDIDQVEYRKASRMDAQAAALLTRRVYQFQAVDATSLGWSSHSVAMLLHQLTAMYEEHHEKFHVTSFYPVRLLFTPDDFHEALDVYAGTLRLNPGSTPIQWLESLQLVTVDSLEAIQHHRDSVMEMTKVVQGALGVKLKKGYSCSSREYYHFLQSINNMELANDDKDSAIQIHSLVLEPILATVEGSAACRRPIVTKEGSIRLGAGMDPATVVQAVAKLAGPARSQLSQEKEDRQRCKEAMQQVQWQFGLQKVYRTGIVSHDQFLQCLTRISSSLSQQQNFDDGMKRRLTGNSLGIAGSGHFCHLADDGSVVVPHDWTGGS